MILSDGEIEYFKNNQNLITPELLEALRAQGNDGKRIALEILDLKQDDRKFYLDAFGGHISFDGNKSLKKIGTVLALTPIHESEIERCSNDFNHFRENYIRIKTPKGVNFPEVRDYQNRFIDAMLNDDYEDVTGLMGRQCVSGDTVLNMQDRPRTIKELFENPEV